MAIMFREISISPSTVNVGQGFVIKIKVATIIVLLDADGTNLQDNTGLILIAKQEESV